MNKVLLSFALALVLAAPAWGIHDFNPPWVANPNDPMWQGGSTTTNVWEFWGEQLGHTAPNPTKTNNPYGTPTFTPVNASPQFINNGPGGTGVRTWHVDSDGGGFFLDIPNNPQDRPYKAIHLQYTSDKASSGAPQIQVQAPGLVTDPQAGGVAGHGPSDGGDVWYTYEWSAAIFPNPQSERIFVPFPASANIGEIEVATICVPEPATLGLLASGAMAVVGGMVWMRRRRR